MSGLPKNSSDRRREALEATANPPDGGDYAWDGQDEDDRPLSREEMRAGIRRRGGRPPAANPKIPLTVRYSPEVVEYFRSTGKGWQTRMDEVLKEYVASQK